MQLHTPSAYPRDDGDYDVHVNWGDRSEPFVIMSLSEDGDLALWLNSAEECDRLIRAAVAAKRKLEAAQAGPHPYEGDGYHCEYCGVYRGHAVHKMPFAAAPAASGQPVTVAEDEPLPDCATPDCGHAEAMHTPQRFGEPIATGPCANCTCAAYTLPKDAPDVAAAIGGLTEAVAEAVNAPETEAGDDDVICATPGCGHRDRHHFGNPNSAGRRGCTGDFVDHGCKCGDFTYPAPETADPAYPDVSGGGVPYPSEAVKSVRRSQEATSW